MARLPGVASGAVAPKDYEGTDDAPCRFSAYAGPKTNAKKLDAPYAWVVIPISTFDWEHLKLAASKTSSSLVNPSR